MFLSTLMLGSNEANNHLSMVFSWWYGVSPFSMNDLIHAEFRGNLEALKENGRNLVELTIKNLDENSMGAMIMFFESLTALMGEILEIDAFDQPGVELGKKYTFQYLDSLSAQKVWPPKILVIN